MIVPISDDMVCGRYPLRQFLIYDVTLYEIMVFDYLSPLLKLFDFEFDVGSFDYLSSFLDLYSRFLTLMY